MTRLRERWTDFWFAPTSPENLGLCRALFYGLVFLLYLVDDASAWSEVSRGFWFPTPFFKWLHVPVLAPNALFIADCTWKLALLAAAFGIATRPAAIVAFAIGVYRLGLPHNYGKVHHFDAMIVLVLGVLAFARTADAWSLDRWIFRRATPVTPSGEYRWPVRAVWLLLSLTFFAAGISKLRHGGVSWVASNNMAILLAQHAYQVANDDPPVSWGLWLSQYPALCSLMALATVFLEVGYPLSLFSRRARFVFPPGMCGALVGIRLLMGPTFPQFIICHLFWVPWDRVLEKVSSRVRPRLPGAVASETSTQ